jgi:hypothetical protein
VPVLADCELISAASAGHTVYLLSHRCLLLGNILKNCTADNGQQLSRFPLMDRGVIADNDFAIAPVRGSLFKLHAPHTVDSGNNTCAPDPTDPKVCVAYPWESATGYTQQVSIVNNIFHGSGDTIWMVNVCPQNGDFDERLRDIVIEGNLFLSEGAGASTGLNVWSTQDVAVRNNIFTGPSAAFNNPINLGCEIGGAKNCASSTVAQAPSRHARIINNTLHFTTTGGKWGIIIDGADDVAIRNNLESGLGTLYPVDVMSGTNVIQSNNLFTTFPKYISSSPTTATDFQLTAASPAVNAGKSVPGAVWDFNASARDAAPDLGAWELAGPADTTPPARPKGLRFQ